MRVLVVDDDSGTVNAIRASLLSRGYEVATAANSCEALEAMNQSIEQSEPIQLMITDFIMPGMNGMDLVRAAKTLLPDLPAILITSYGISEVRKETMNLDDCVYLEKPFDLESLEETIRRSANSGT